MNGIDISAYQRDIELNKIPSEVKYVYIKATEGMDYIDPALNTLYEKAKNSNKLFGFYHFMSELTDPTRQAEDFYNAIKNKSFTLIPVLDIETNNKKRTKEEVTNRALQFLKRFKELSNMDCIVYTYTSFANSYLDTRLSGYKCWIADYNNANTVNANNVWSTFVGHQYSGSGNITGYNGQIDLNNFSNAIELNSKVKSSVNVKTNKTLSYKAYDIAILQQELNSQCKANLVVDNIAGPKTLNACITVRQGARGNITRWIQNKLNSLGYNCGVADGIFGNGTKQAIMKLQQTRGLSVDGIVGKNTWRALLGML